MTDLSKFSIDPAMNPKSVAIVGASPTEGKMGYKVMKNIINSGFKGKVFAVNPKGGEPILGFSVFKSVLDIPEPVDMAVFVIPAKACVSSAEECGKKGVKSLVLITAGFKEVGGEGAELEKKVVALGKKYNMRIVGPNCLGIVNFQGNFTFASSPSQTGSIAMISQSGAMATALLDWSIGKLGFSAFISLGNKADVDETDFIEYLGAHEQTKVIIGYLESIVDGARFYKVCSEVSKKKPIILIKGGRSSAGAKAASSHTGALAGSDMAVDLAFQKCGVIRAYAMADLFNYAQAFISCPIPKGTDYAIVTNAGGPGIVTTDAIEAEKLGWAHFSKETEEKLGKNLPAEANIHNPVDIIGDAPPERYETAIDILFQSPVSEIAGAVILLTPQAQTNPPVVAEKIALLNKKYPDRVLVAAFMGGPTVLEPSKMLSKTGVPTYPFPEDAVKVAKSLDTYGKILRREAPIERKCSKVKVDDKRVLEIFEGARKDGRTQLLSYETSEVFKIFGIKHPQSKLAKTAEEAGKFAAEVGFPIVAKIVSPQIIHKFDIGGVVLSIKSSEEAKKAFDVIMNNAKTKEPNAKLYGVEIQKMITSEGKKKKTEIILGMSRDPTWGPQIMFGQGGIYANYTQDVAFELAWNFDKDDAMNLIKRTKVSRILEGVRGEPKSDIDGLVDTLCKLAQLVNDYDAVKELDINPCLVFEDETQSVDIKITIK